MDNQAEFEAIDEGLLVRLSALLGIEGEFYDYKGEHHITQMSVRHKLIQAMGFKIKDNAQVQRQIERLEMQEWTQTLAPVVVLRESWDKAVEINVPEEFLAVTAMWQMQYEAGDIITDEFIPQDLEYLSESNINGQRILRYRLRFPFDIPLGYHELHINAKANLAFNAHCSVIVAPMQCYQPEVLQQGQRLWGLGVQLYTLRSADNWGIGDFSDLRQLIVAATKFSAGFIGLNPLHALFTANPHHKSPYSPSSRLFLNYLYLDVQVLEDYKASQEACSLVELETFQSRLGELRDSDHVDYAGVAELKLQILRMAYASFVEQHVKKNTIRATEFQEYIQECGAELKKQAAYDALYSQYFETGHGGSGWWTWPEAYRKPSNQEVLDYISEHSDEIRFYQYLQWLSDQQLALAQQAARESGMEIGLYRDLAVGVDSGGAETWSQQDSYSFDATVGAPPDPIALQGQDWGLPPLNPGALYASGYSAFIKLIRANMRHCGALRIDHVMSLYRLWWVPKGEIATEGSYIYYTLNDMLGILALESARQQCMVIGEDLGTVPEQIRTAMPEANIYSYKVMYFEKEGDNQFKPPQHYATRAMATISTHDLPTLNGWWTGEDLNMRDEMELFPNEEVREQEYKAREHDRWALLEALKASGNLPADIPLEAGQLPKMTMSLSTAIHKQLAHSNAALMVVHPEDLILMSKPVNVPGTTDQYPNWQRKLEKSTVKIFAPRLVRALLKEISEIRRNIQ